MILKQVEQLRYISSIFRKWLKYIQSQGKIIRPFQELFLFNNYRSRHVSNNIKGLERRQDKRLERRFVIHNQPYVRH